MPYKRLEKLVHGLSANTKVFHRWRCPLDPLALVPIAHIPPKKNQGTNARPNKHLRQIEWWLLRIHYRTSLM